MESPGSLKDVLSQIRDPDLFEVLRTKIEEVAVLQDKATTLYRSAELVESMKPSGCVMDSDLESIAAAIMECEAACKSIMAEINSAVKEFNGPLRRSEQLLKDRQIMFEKLYEIGLQDVFPEVMISFAEEHRENICVVDAMRKEILGSESAEDKLSAPH
mgnify:CR=1 FL=1